MTVKAELSKMFLSLEGLDPTKDSDYVITFVVACWIVGIAVLIFDLCYLHIVGKSALKLRHSVGRTPVFFITWPIGSVIFGYLALVLHVVQPTMLGSLAAGITWATSTKSIFKKLTTPQEPEQDTQGEDES